jgi:phospholipid transport system substrate-binding protein
MTLRSILVALLLVGLAALPARASDADQAKAVIDGMAQRAISVLKETGQGDRASREAQFRQIFQDSFDIPKIGQFVLGIYWRRASEQQRTEYLKLFESFVVKTYAERLSQYSGEKLQVDGARSNGEKTTVDSEILRTQSGQPIRIAWELEKNAGGQFKVTDVIIERVSMSQTQRSDFSSFISQNGGSIDALINKLRSMTAHK